MLLVALLLAAAPSADEVARSRVHFQAGKTHYELGRYSEAIREFAAGYALAPRPEFLINLGQAYRASGDARAALEMFERYLEKAPAGAKPRGQVEQLVATLKDELAKQPAPEPPPPQPVAPTASDAPVQATLTPPAPASEPPRAPEPAVVAAPAGPSPLVWVLPVVAVVVAGVVVGTVVAVNAATPACGTAGSLGCVDLRSK